MIVSTTDELLYQHVKRIVEHTGETPLVYAAIEDIPASVAEQTTCLITFGNDLTADNIRAFPKLQWIQMCSAGLEDLPFSALHERGILVTSATGIHVVPMSEYVVLCMLHFEKDMERYRSLKEQKVFDRTKLVGELIHREVLIYGTGVIGQAVANLLKVFRMEVYGVNTSGRPVEPFRETYKLGEETERLESADYVISILPSTSQTRGLFSADYLERMKRDAVLISIGRGDVIDENHVVDMLKNGRLKGAAFDVFQKEPLPVDSPLWECENLILTPHMSAKSIHYIDRCVDIFLHNWQALRDQTPLKNVVDTLREY
ncbi:MAG: D-2-hydroxyacid dehydrogenase [Clostridia bacterium]